MNKIYFIITVAILLIVSSCKRNTFETKIADQIKNTCQEKSECFISIKNLTDFTWDKMHVFKYNATLNDVNKAIGTNVNKYTEFTRRIIFTLHGSIVFDEEQPTNMEGLTDGEIVFDIPDSVAYKSYDIDKATFLARIRESTNGTYYELTQVNQ